MDRCWLQGAMALYALSSAAGYNIRWLCGPLFVMARAGFFLPCRP
jgi:hypothetical protein